jgi:hypothetical protein
MVTVEKTLIVDHIPSGENPSDEMTKNLPDKLHAHHAACIYDGLLNDYTQQLTTSTDCLMRVKRQGFQGALARLTVCIGSGRIALQHGRACFRVRVAFRL